VKFLLGRLLAASALTIAASASERNEAVSADGVWHLYTDVSSLEMGRKADLVISMQKSTRRCPILKDLVFDMPQHGHGSDYKPAFQATDSCHWQLHDLEPTMRGQWRLRLVLVQGLTTTVADFYLDAQ
jgi:hypothetical protein